jgi:hypothetical protein
LLFNSALYSLAKRKEFPTSPPAEKESKSCRIAARNLPATLALLNFLSARAAVASSPNLR